MIGIGVGIAAASAIIFFYLGTGRNGVRESQSPYFWQSTAQVPDSWVLYKSEKHGFSIRLPAGFEAQATDIEDATVYFFKNVAGGEFQVFVTPFDEFGPLSEERIRQDIPEMKAEDLREVTIGGESASVFLDATGEKKLREAWFVHNGYLHQASAPIEFDETLSRIMATWKFE